MEKKGLEKDWQIPQTIIDHYKKYVNKNENLKKTEVQKGLEFEIDEKYKILEIVGRGAYGVVVAAQIKGTDKMVAIKKISKAFEHKIFAKRTLRELKILRNLNHENILNITTLILPKSRQDFNDIYIVTELVEGDLYSIIKSSQKFEEDHVKFIIYQILRALKYQHSGKVLHRDLKPRNILISSVCEVRVCDYGLARLYNDDSRAKTENLTDYVATRWYRAPELLLANESYDEKIEVWSVGCILAEMYLRKPFLMGVDWKNQLYLILDLLSTPKKEDTDFIENPKAKEFLANYPENPSEKLTSYFEDVDISKEGFDLLKKMLVFNPNKRVSIEEALKHEYLKDLYCPEDEPIREPLNSQEFEFENENLNKEQIKDLIYEEILLYHFDDVKKNYEDKLKNGKSIIQHIMKNENKDFSHYEQEDIKEDD